MASEMDEARADLDVDEKEDVQPFCGQRFHGEEVTGE